VLDGFTLELLEFDPAAQPDAGARIFNRTGLTHISLSIADIPAVLKRVEAYGGSIFSGEGGSYMIRDPDGQLIEILSVKFHQDIEAGRAARRQESRAGGAK